ncbi:manganese efflux pump MntP [Thalassotalea piscium]|uniref:Putative manganese efflux pump MntP n=1 Tax=Thalassotalea piscium TaxID=1230533 RepID=A0A7X0NEK8_9GAMM|nr:manganese efflux pump MntP family protein [Thalassotalea piscium]MBB6542005.1 putative Mn2+ efflux pump MntP [Thalassotalea piscium]
MIEVIALAIALSMDAFAVSIGLGSKRTQSITALALISALYFGFFQAVMPLIGYAGGIGILGLLNDYLSWVSFLLLLIIGGKMIYESSKSNGQDEIVNITHKIMLLLAVATSIDAMAAGVTLTILEVNPFVACLIIGITTFAFSWVGVFVGAKSGTWLENKAEFFGGIVLIAIGIKILLPL